jgi:hypothetical protein
MQEFENVRLAIDKLLNVKSAIKRKKQNKQTQARELFVSIINSLQMVQTRATIMFSDLKLDYSTYDEPFLEIIDALLLMKFGKEASEIISYYMWERYNPDGTVNEIYDEYDNVIPLENANDLWNVVLKLSTDKDK